MDTLYTQVLNKILNELSKDDTEIKFKLIDPLINYMGNKMLPYIMFTVILLTFIIVTIVYFMFIMCFRNSPINLNV